jgi:5'-nucleotidase / UDP-sugar diphosphatase
MRISTALTALPLLGLLLGAACGDDEGDDDNDGEEPVTRKLVLFHTNDEHSHLFGFAPEVDDFPLPTEPGDGAIVGSIARRAVVLDEQRAALADGTDSLTVSAGDQTQGALPQIAFETTSPDFTLMAQLGYDIMCPGNHEFDLGPDAYANAIQAAGPDMPPIVSTNIHFSDDAGDDPLEELYGEGGSDAAIAPYQVIETPNGLRVGFIGIMGVSAALFAPNKAPVQFSGDLADEGDREAILPALYDDIRPVVETLRDDEAVDVVVALSHSGVDTATPEFGDDYNIAQNVAGIDVIISGHTHTPLEEPIVVEGPDGHQVPIVQAGAYGKFLGRIALTHTTGERAELDTGGDTGLLLVDDTIVAEDDEIVDQLDDLIADLEASVLPEQLSLIEGTEIADDPKELGDLYYRPMGATDFDIIGLRIKTETNMLNLSNDAKLAAAEEFGGPTDLAIEASGTVRDDILVGRDGIMSYADLYRVFPLGENPLNGSIGFPLSRFYLFSAEIKAAFEVGVDRGYIDDSIYLSGSGVRVEYDTNRDPQVLMSMLDALDPENGRITKITIDTDKSDTFDETDLVMFDLSRESPWDDGTGSSPLTLHSVVTSLYIASFADSAGITLKDAAGGMLDLFDTILRRPDKTEVKDYEAFVRYVLVLAQENKGFLPAKYDEDSEAGSIPRHMICTGPLCM